MVNLIHNMPISKVNGHDDNNNNNISKYLELNKEIVLAKIKIENSDSIAIKKIIIDS